MKSTAKKAPCVPPKPQEYPVLGIYPNKEVVLFTSAKKGTCVDNPVRQGKVGTNSNDYTQGWIEYTGSVCLEN